MSFLKLETLVEIQFIFEGWLTLTKNWKKLKKNGDNFLEMFPTIPSPIFQIFLRYKHKISTFKKNKNVKKIGGEGGFFWK